MSGFKTYVFLALAALFMNASSQFLIESPKVTDWGGWGVLEMCDAGSYVFGFRLKVEPYQGVASDDCSLSAIELLCISLSAKRDASAPLTESRSGLESKAFSTLLSRQGHRGAWGAVQECPEPGFAVGFQLKSEGNQGWYADDTAANGMRLLCSGGQTLDSGNEMNYGSWTAENRCPRGHFACGLQTQVEDPQSLDDTTLNNVKFVCCQY